jgi:integrase/recombinase XerD
MSYPSLSVAIEGFLLSKAASGRSPYTLRNYKKELERFSEWVQDPPIDQITSKNLEEYMRYLREDFRITHQGTTAVEPRKLSVKTVRNCWGTLSCFWRWASKEFEFENPFHIEPIKFYTKPISPLREEEVEKLLSACNQVSKISSTKQTYISKRNTQKRDRAILLTLLDTGVRAGELCNIKIHDLELDIGRIYVTGKGNKSRYVYFGKITRQAIWRYLVERFPNEKPPQNEALFTARDGLHALTRHGALLLIKRLGLRVGVPNVHPHRFRHTFAIQFLKNGGNVFELQQLLGHSDLNMVKKYVQIAQMDLEASARKASPADNWKLR